MNIPATKLFHYIKSNILYGSELKKHLAAHPDMERRIGSLPYEWLGNVKREDISEVTGRIFSALEEFSKVRYEQGVCCYNFYDYEDNAAYASKKLLKTLQKELNREDINIDTNIGNGKFKVCTKLTVGDKSYALSSFSKTNILDYAAHGAMYEPQMSFLAYKRGSQGRYARPFMARAFSTINGSFILSKFIDKTHPVKCEMSPILRSREFIQNPDAPGENTIRGIAIDHGGSFVNDKYIKDPKIRNTWRKFAQKLNSENMLFCLPTHCINGKAECITGVQDYLYKLKEQGVDLCTVDAREIINDLSPARQVVAKKILRVLRKARKLKNEAIERGDFEYYQKLLSEDLRDNYRFRFYSEDLINCNIRQGYPKLVAQELGISNVPDIWEFKHLIDINMFNPGTLPKYIKRADIIQWLYECYEHFDFESFFAQEIVKVFHLKKESEILRLKKNIQQLEIRMRKLSENEYESPSAIIKLQSKLADNKKRLCELQNKMR